MHVQRIYALEKLEKLLVFSALAYAKRRLQPTSPTEECAVMPAAHGSPTPRHVPILSRRTRAGPMTRAQTAWEMIMAKTK